jgi:hypothetical protein
VEQVDAQAILGWGGRRTEHTDSEIMPTHVYCKEKERLCGLLPGSVFFRLVAPPQLEVVGAYPILGV